MMESSFSAAATKNFQTAPATMYPPAARVVEVMNPARSAGLYRLAIVTQPKGGAPRR